MNKVFIIDGGLGRVITAIPALERYVTEHPEDNVSILVYAWDPLFWSNKLLQNLTFNVNDKGTFDKHFKNADVVVNPEPYKLPSYYRQEVSLSEAFDILINGDSKGKKVPRLYLTPQEMASAHNVIQDVKKYQPAKKTVVIQPFGSTCNFHTNGVDADTVDTSSRSLSLQMYSKIAGEIRKKYNLILFADNKFHFKEDNFSYKLSGDIRTHMSVIKVSDYFIGCDSVGQHIARAFDKPGTVIFGSTFPVNVSYPDWFNIIDFKNDRKVYSPMRINDIDCNMADRTNVETMNYNAKEIDEVSASIMKHIKSKIGE